jgi:hypothetical protein
MCVDYSWNFVHSYLVKYYGLLCCRILEGQALIWEAECTPPQTPIYT